MFNNSESSIELFWTAIKKLTYHQKGIHCCYEIWSIYRFQYNFICKYDFNSFHPFKNENSGKLISLSYFKISNQSNNKIIQLQHNNYININLLRHFASSDDDNAIHIHFLVSIKKFDYLKQSCHQTQCFRNKFKNCSTATTFPFYSKRNNINLLILFLWMISFRSFLIYALK